MRAKKKGALTPSAHAIRGQVPENSAGTTVRNRGAPAAVPQDVETDGAAVVGATVVRTPEAALTRVALSAPQQAAVPTAIAAAATPTATVTTARRGADGGIPNAPQTLNMREGGTEDVEDPGDTSTPLRLQKTRALDRAATAAGKGTGDTTGAAPEVPAAGAAAPVPGPGGAVTVEAAAQAAAPPAPTKAPHEDEVPEVEQTVIHIAETSIALTFTAPSRHAHHHHEALTATHTHPALRVFGREGPEMQGNRKTHSLLASCWRRFSPRGALMILPQERNLGSRSRIHHRDTLVLNSLHPWEAKPCCLCLANCRQGRSP